MKKFLLFAGVLYVLFLVSFKEKSLEPESFVKILKDHPERLEELLEVAETYKVTFEGPDKILNPEDIITEAQLDIFREHTKSRPRRPWDESPVNIISTKALHALIKDHLELTDSIVFFYGRYSKKDKVRIDRYNQRNGGPKFSPDNPPFKYKNLKKRTAFAMQVFSTVNSSSSKSKSSAAFFNTGNIFKSVGKGSNDVEINNDWTNTFKIERIARSPIYEISRLCPPPPEGCF